jgi:hypothetical protein
MKTRNCLISAALAVVLFAACSQPSAKGTGSVRIDIPAKYLASASKDADSSKDSTPKLRVFIEARGSFVPLVAGSTSSYYETVIKDNSVTIDDVNPVVNANLYFSLGRTNSSGVFVVTDYAAASSVTITAAATTSVTASHYLSPFTPLDCASDSSGIKATVVGGKIYAVDGGKLYSYAPDTWTKSGSLADLSGLAVNGIEAGKVYSSTARLDGDAVWLDTSSGIRSYNVGSAALDTSALGESGGNTLDSGCFTLSLDGTSYDVIYYQAKAFLGFAYYSGGKWNWNTLSGIASSSGVDISSLLNMVSSRIITDMDVNSDPSSGYFYLVSPIKNIGCKLSAFEKLLLPEFKKAGKDISKLLTAADSVKITSPQEGTVISSISRGGDYLYLGTDRHLYCGKASSASSGYESFSFSAIDSAVTEIVKVKACSYGDASYAAAITADGNLLVCKDGALVKTYKSYMGLPSLGSDPASTARVFWTDKGLVVSGVDGLAVLGFGKI